MDPANYLDFGQIILYELIGDIWLAAFVILGIIFFTAIKTKMPTELIILFGILFLSILVAKVYLEIIWVFVVLGVGVIFYYLIQKVFR